MKLGINVKNLLIVIAVLFILQSCNELPDQPQPISKELEHIHLNPKLIHGTYSFSGTITSEMGSFISNYTFSGKANTDSFYIQWMNDRKSHFSPNENETLSIDSSGAILHFSGMTQNFTDLRTAVASATGISMGCARLMYSLWNGDRFDVFQSNQPSVQVQDNGRIVITGKTQNGARSNEVTIVDGLPSSVIDIYDPKLDTKRQEAPQMTDENIKDMLEKMNRPVNDEEIAKIRDNLAKANESMKNVHDIIKTTTVVTITVLGN